MTDDANLVLGIDASGMKKGAAEGEAALNKIDKKSIATEKALKAAGIGAKKTGDDFNSLGKAVSAIDGPLGGIASRFTAIKGLISNDGLRIGALSIALAGAGFALKRASAEARVFEKSMAEVATLVDKTTFNFSNLEKGVRSLSRNYGIAATEQAAGAYQAISAGATSAAQALDVLETANKLAIGGVTNVTTAITGLSSALNVYRSEGVTATEISDSLFVGMKQGVTTIGELSGALGNVTPLAKALGVSFDEVVASTAALTKTGISTSQAVTALRSVFSSVIQPSEQARKAAAALGIEFSAAGLKAKGLEGFLADVIVKTQGSEKALATLFGQIEGVSGVIALANGGFDDFTGILAEMENKTGATEGALKDMQGTADQVQKVFGQNLSSAFISLGNIANSVLTPSLMFINENFETLQILGTAAATLITGKLVIAMASFAGITSIAGAAISAIPFVALIGGFAFAISKIVEAKNELGGWQGALMAWQTAFDAMIVTVLQWANSVLGAVKGVVEGVKQQFAAIGNLATAAYKDVIGVVTGDTGNVARALDAALGGAYTTAYDNIKKDTMRFNDALDKEFESRTLDRAKKIQKLLKQGAADALPNKTDGGFVFNPDKLKEIEGLLEGLGRSSSKAGDGVKKLRVETEKLSKEQSALLRIFDETRTPAEKLRIELAALEKLRPFADTPELMDALNRKITALQKPVEKLGVKFEETAQIFRDIATDISNGFTNMFETLFKDGIGGFSSMAKSIGDIFRRLLARLATLAVAQPVIIPIVQGVGGALGLGKGTIGEVTKQLGLGSGTGSNPIGSIFQQGSSLLGATKIGGAINAFGASALPSLFAPAAIGPTALSAGLGGAPAAGGLLGGAGIGLSSLALPVAGLAIGAVASQLFKKKPKSVASNFGGTVGAGGDLSGLVIRTNGKGDPETARALSQGVQDIARGLLEAGLDVSGQIIQGGVDAGRGFLGVGNTDYLALRGGAGGAINFNPQGGEAAVSGALAQLATQLALSANNANQYSEALKRVQSEGRTAEQVLDDIKFITAFERLGEEFINVVKPASDFEIIVGNIRAQFDDARVRAEGFGLSIETLNKRLAMAEGELRKQFNESVSRQLFDASGLGGIITEVERYQQQLKEAQLIGGDIQRVELLHQFNMQRLINDTNTQQISALQEQAREAGGLAAAYGRVAATLRESINGIIGGQFTILSPFEQLQQSQRLFDDAASRARGGDIEAAGSLPALANNLLSQGRGFFASGSDFAKLQRDTVAKLEEAERVAGQQVDIQTRIFQSSENQVRVLQGGFDSVTRAVNDAAVMQLASLRGLTGAGFSAGNFNDRIVSIFGGGLTGASGDVASQIRNIFSQTIGNVQEGGGRVTAAFNANQSANQRAFELARQLGIPGFANGGSFSGTGLVGERGAEFITTSRQATVIPYQANKEVVDGIRASNDNMRVMVNVMQQGFMQMIDKQAELINAVREGNRTQRVSGKRKDA